nr:reverse transcriptase [Tanacetum cinerariifolium]
MNPKILSNECSLSPSSLRKYFMSSLWKKISGLVHVQSSSGFVARKGLMHRPEREQNKILGRSLGGRLAKGKPGLACIGGLLRNSEGGVVALFSVPVGVMDSNVVEVLAIKEASEFNSVKIVSESDYLNAVSWDRTPIMRPWRFLPYFHKVDIFVSSSSSHSIVHVDRECNSDADKLAKDMVYQTSLLSIWKDD